MASEWIVLDDRPSVEHISRDEAWMTGNGRGKSGGEGKSSSFTVSDAIVERLVAWGADIPTVPPTLRPKQAKQLEQALQQDSDAPAIREQMRRQEITRVNGER